jgi:hypothetical protein
MSKQTVSFVSSMVARFPSLYRLLEDHIRDNAGEVLPHVFFGEVTRYVLSLLVAARGEPRRELIGDVLSYLEEAYAAGDEELRELISVSFLENLPGPGESGAEVREMVGQNLRRQLQLIG